MICSKCNKEKNTTEFRFEKNGDSSTIADVPTSSPNNAKPNVSRRFSVGDWVFYKPYENCSKVDISGKGEIIEVLSDGEYKVTFGHRSMYGTRTGKYHWTKLWLASENGG